jgi:acyl carrier protein
MSLEADLGIDSIKRVEILSALRDLAPETPEADAETMGRLRTLGQVATFLGAPPPAGQGEPPSPF